MISVPDAGLFPITPRPVLCMNGSITSCGKPCGYVGIGCGVRMPISSQCPVVVSLPFERSIRRPATAVRPPAAGSPRSGSTLPRPERLEVRQVEAPYGASNVPEGVRALVAVFGGVRKLAGTHGIEHDDTRPRHAGYSRSTMMDVLGLLAMLVFCAAVIALARRSDGPRREALTLEAELRLGR